MWIYLGNSRLCFTDWLEDGDPDILVSGFYGYIEYYENATTGIEELRETRITDKYKEATIFSGPLQLPKDKTCKVFDIMGRQVIPDKILPGVYFLEIDGEITNKVIKIK